MVRRGPAEPTDRPAETDCGWLWPAGIVCDIDDRVIASDEDDQTITIVSSRDKRVARWREHGSEPCQLGRSRP